MTTDSLGLCSDSYFVDSTSVIRLAFLSDICHPPCQKEKRNHRANPRAVPDGPDQEAKSTNLQNFPTGLLYIGILHRIWNPNLWIPRPVLDLCLTHQVVMNVYVFCRLNCSLRAELSFYLLSFPSATDNYWWLPLLSS